MTKPKIAVIGTGGTIVSSGSTATQMTGYSITDADIHTIVTALPELNDIAEIATFSVFNIGSSNINLSNWLKLVRLINKLSEDDYDGFVVTHGTDTMEETAFFANLTLKTDKPVVFTGSMKPDSALSADGPLNLLNAVRLAGSPKAQGKGVLVALNGAIHGARDVVKTNSVAVETFKSPNSGPLGYIIGDQIEFLTESAKPHTLQSCFEVDETDTADKYPKVCALLCCADQNSDFLEAAIDKDYHGIVWKRFRSVGIRTRPSEGPERHLRAFQQDRKRTCNRGDDAVASQRYYSLRNLKSSKSKNPASVKP